MKTLATAALLLALAACDSTEIRPGVFDPYDTSRPYSVYAVLRATDEEHTIRVQTIRRESDPPQTEAEAIVSAPRVVTVDAATGDSLVWARATQQLSDGTYAAVYTARFEPAAYRTVELLLTRDDGANASGQATVPDAEAPPTVAEPQSTPDGVVTSVRWDQFGSLREARAFVAYRLDPNAQMPTIQEVAVDADPSPGAEPVVSVNLSAASQAVRDARELTMDAPIYLYAVDIVVDGTSPGWTSAGGDPVAAATSGNIQGAVGRFGFVDEGRASVLPAPEWIAAAGFTPAP